MRRISLSHSDLPPMVLDHSLDSLTALSPALDRFIAGFESVLESRVDFMQFGQCCPLPTFEAADIMELCDMATDYFRQQPVVLRIDCGVVIVGDIHGSFHDLVRIFHVCGLHRTFLFLGDYVDRGEFSLECILLLFALMLHHPGQIHLLRGNHETREIATTYGFKTEIAEHYPDIVFDAFCQAFSWMPLAAIVHGRIFGVHGGLGRTVHTVAQIEAYERPINDGPLPEEVNMLLWADPTANCAYFLEAASRNRGIQYGPSAVRDFLERNGLELIIRAHECVDGVRAMGGMPVITVFSSSNYHIGSHNRSGIIVAQPGKPLKPHYFNAIEKIRRSDASFFTFARPSASEHKLQKITRSAGSFRVLNPATWLLVGRRTSIGKSSSILSGQVRSTLRAQKTAVEARVSNPDQTAEHGDT
jgi:diadenosine tetraphosphatase ApaH/serine/threonine PP2A family protein phosphatase